MLRYVLITIAAFCIHVLVFSAFRLCVPDVSIEAALKLNLWSQAIRLHVGLTILIIIDQVGVLCSVLKVSSPFYLP